MKRRSRWLVVALLVAVVAVLAAYLLENRAQLFALVTARPEFLLLVLVLQSARTFARGLIDRILLGLIGTRIGVPESFWLANASGSSDLLLPQSGTALRAVYLRRRYGLEYVTFLGTAVAITPVRMGMTAMLAAVALLPLVAGSGALAARVAFGAAVGVVAAMILVGCLPRFSRRGHWAWDRLAQLVEAWWQLRSNPRQLAWACLWMVFMRLCETTSLWCAAMAAGLHIRWSEALIVASLKGMLIFASVLPGNLGIEEAVSVLVGSLVGMSPLEAVAVALLLRAVVGVRALVFAPVATWFLSRGDQSASEYVPAVTEPLPAQSADQAA